RGAVHATRGGAWSIDAVDQGTMPYAVNFSTVDGFWGYSCTCPYFERDFEPCKHIWAACLAAEHKGYLKGTADVDSSDFSAAVPDVFFRRTYPKPAGVKKTAPASGWRKQLQPLLAQMGADEKRFRFQPATKQH